MKDLNLKRCLSRWWILLLTIITLTIAFSSAAMEVRKTGGNVKANGIQIEYEAFGDPSSPPLLLINGLGMQMIFWEEEFCKQLASKGFYVIRFDNRDVGLSTKFEKAGVPNIMEVVTTLRQGKQYKPPYTLDDMADDAVGLLDALGIKKAHICGESMGAAITQVIGYRHPSRILSLIIISGTTGNPNLPPMKPEARKIFQTPPPMDREANIEYNVNIFFKVIWGSFPYDEDHMRKQAAALYDRSFYPQGAARQMVASIVNGNRKLRLASVTAPTLVIHGTDDPIFRVECGKDIAESIPGAQLLVIDKMGHGILPKEVWTQVIDDIVKHTGGIKF
jgi:pimeloyl-ACP methyl ester carboxylesterase